MGKPGFEKPITQAELKRVLSECARALAAEEAGTSDAPLRIAMAGEELRALGDRYAFRAMRLRADRYDRPRTQAFAAVAREMAEVRTGERVAVSMWADTWDRLRAAFGHKTGTRWDGGS